MEPKETKITIEAKDGKPIFIGKDVRVLEDHTKFTYETDDPRNFVDYCKDIAADDGVVYYGSDRLKLNHNKPDRYSKPYAKCEVSLTNFVTMLASAIDKPMSLEEFETFLFTLRPFSCQAALTLYTYTRNFQVKKVTSVKREIDSKGNYNHHIQRESGATDDVQLPESIQFNVPVINALATEFYAPFKFDLVFKFSETDNCARMSFVLKNPMFRMELNNAFKTILDSYLKDLSYPKYWGDAVVELQDNKWQEILKGSL